MATGRRDSGKRFRLWPGIAVPLGMTCLVGIAAWFFLAKIAGEQDRADAAAKRLEGYALLEAGEIANLVAEHAGGYVASRRGQRRNQEKNLRLEVRGIMDGVYRLLTAGLEQSRKNAVARRDVGRFPPGFEGVRSFLEISPLGPETDEALETLRSFATELAALLPAGCSLAVIEDNSRELLSLGGGTIPERSVSEAIVREFIFDDGGRNRHWALRVELHVPDLHPHPTASETAEFLSQQLAHIKLDMVAWRGWLIGSDGEAVAVFPAEKHAAPAAGSGLELPPYINMPGEWVEIEGRWRVWLERLSAAGRGLEWIPAVAVAIAKPPPPLEPWTELVGDARWCLTLAGLGILALGCWVWLFRAWLTGSRIAPEEADEAAPADARVRRRLVRDESLSRSIPEVQGVIVAEIGPDGTVNLSAAPSPMPPPTPQKPKVMPSGSLFRLQGIHRGREGMQGSRILDHAKSPVLRELAVRVRPAPGLGAPAESRRTPAPGQGAAIPSMKSVAGWKKVDE